MKVIISSNKRIGAGRMVHLALLHDHHKGMADTQEWWRLRIYSIVGILILYTKSVITER